MMSFKPKNLNILTPMWIAIAFLVLAVLQISGMAWPNSVLFAFGEFRFSVMSIAAILLAVGVLLDARR